MQRIQAEEAAAVLIRLAHPSFWNFSRSLDWMAPPRTLGIDVEIRNPATLYEGDPEPLIAGDCIL